jgi:hypothetical protein
MKSKYIRILSKLKSHSIKVCRNWRDFEDKALLFFPPKLALLEVNC